MRSFFLVALALVAASANAFSVRSSVASESWMKSIKDDTPLYELVLPGTHDSAAYTMNVPIAREFVVTQTSNISEQLTRGIRYVDFRVGVCEGTTNSMCMFHGKVYLKLSLGAAVGMVKSFLAQSPSETVVMRLQHENGKEPDDFQGFIETNYIKQDPSLWYAGNKTAAAVTVGDARGKIVLLWNSGSKTSEFGYDYKLVDTRTAWEFNSIKDMSNTFEKRASQAASATGWFENPASGLVYMSIFGVRWFSPDAIQKTAKEMLPRAAKIWAASPMKKGIVSMDYPTDEFIGSLISTSLDRFVTK
jgi:hypothetical protein